MVASVERAAAAMTTTKGAASAEGRLNPSICQAAERLGLDLGSVVFLDARGDRIVFITKDGDDDD
jgi:hypothetical protein